MSYETDMRYLLSEIDSLKRRLQFQERLETQVSAYGWISAGETWTYASSTTVTISGDKTAKYSKGMKVKLTQTTVKYFYITAVSYSAPNTTLTLTAGSDYTVANATITSPYYSMVANPAGFPRLFNFTANATGFSSKTIDAGVFTISGNIAYIHGRIQGTSNATTLGFTPPIPLTMYLFIGWVYQPAVSSNPALGEPSGNNINVYKDGAVTAWSSSGNKDLIFSYTQDF